MRQLVPTNKVPRFACALLLDVSRSMANERINALNAGVQHFISKCQNDQGMISKSIEIGIIAFADTADVILDFMPVEQVRFSPLFTRGSWTNLGAAVETGISMVRARTAEYRSTVGAAYAPWIVIFTDGEPNVRGWEQAAKRLRWYSELQGSNADKITVFAFGVGADWDNNVNGAKDILALFSPAKRKPLGVQLARMNQLFDLLKDYGDRVSVSRVGHDVPVEGFAEAAGSGVFTSRSVSQAIEWDDEPDL
jgi:uncharacterized protein YegL